MEFGVLGPLQTGGGEVVLAAKQRIVLAVLLLHANRVVPVDTLIDALWDDAPPPSARTTLQGYIKQLRHNSDIQAGERVVTRSPGYLMTVAADELDLSRFAGLCDQARLAADSRDWPRAASLFRDALALWRGDPLTDVPSAVLQRTEVPRLAELRMRAIESRVEADLWLGRHADLVAELRQLAGGEPLRERLHGQLMLALYRCGRQAEALAAFRGIDQQLHDELGMRAGAELQRLHQRILAADSSLDGGVALAADTRLVPGAAVALAREVTPAAGPAAAGPAAGGPPVVPAQLPPDTTDFTGRDEQVKLLCGLLDTPPDRERPGAVMISAVAGMGGIGKTALAVHVAHRLRSRFPDGQLYVSLQGTTSPLRPAEVLSRLLRDLGEPDTAIPVSEEERAARYRSLLAGREMLIVLDDARDAAQVRPLLPGSASCAVIVTSRGMLAGLAGATQLNLDALAAYEARVLFASIIGEPRAAAAPEATAAVLASCAGLPLAIRIAGSRLASRPAWNVAQLAARLAGQRDRLAELTAGDLAVRASFAVSYDALPASGAGARDGAGGAGPGSADPAWLFRLLGLSDMAELSLPAIAALAGQPPAQAAVALETLTDACLLQSPAPDRYRLHDLLRSYAAELAEHTDSGEERGAAIGRMLSWYGEQCVAAARTLAPARNLLVVIPGSDGTQETVAMAGPADAFAWFEAEAVNLAVAACQAASAGRDDISAQIAIGMLEFFQRTADIETWLSVCQRGVWSARRLRDDAALSFLLLSLGQGYGEVRRFAEAERCFTAALEIRRRTGDNAGAGIALNCLAVSLIRQDQPEPALECLRSALDILVDAHDQRGTGTVLNNIGDALWSLKRYAEALDHLERSLAIRQEIGDGFRVCTTETTIGQVYLDMGRYEEAAEHCRRALSAHHGTARDHRNRAEALYTLGRAVAVLGRTSEAHEAWLTALPILDRLGDPRAADLRRLTDASRTHMGPARPDGARGHLRPGCPEPDAPVPLAVTR